MSASEYLACSWQIGSQFSVIKNIGMYFTTFIMTAYEEYKQG